jgi:hypothetical protein
MTSATQHRTFLTIRVLFLFSVAVCLLQAPASGQDRNPASLKEAVSRLGHFQNDVRNMRSIVGKPLGPYNISGQCTWCSYAWGSLCWENTTASWSNVLVDFSWTRQGLQRVLSEAEHNADNFTNSYAPTQAWIDGLPEFSRKFNATADLILAVQQEIKAGTGPTDQQYQIVKQALQKLAGDLRSSSEQLQMGTRALAVSLDRQSSYREPIRQAINGADRSAQEALNSIRKQYEAIEAHPECQAVFNEKFNPIRADFSRSIQEISGAFQKLEASSREAEKGLAVLLGSVVSSQTELQTVLQLLSAAQQDQLGSFLERLHLTAAKKQWEDLARVR